MSCINAHTAHLRQVFMKECLAACQFWSEVADVEALLKKYMAMKLTAKVRPGDAFIAIRTIRVWHGQTLALGRWKMPTFSRRACSPQCGLQPWRGGSAGVANRPRELICR